MQDICSSTFCFIIDSRCRYQGDVAAVFFLPAGYCIQLPLQMTKRTAAAFPHVTGRNGLPPALHAGCRCLPLQIFHDHTRQSEKFPVPAAAIPGKHHTHIGRPAHQLPQDRHGLGRETVKPVHPDLASPEKFGQVDFAQKEVDIVFRIGIFAVNLLFIASVEQGQILQLPPGIGPRLCFRGHGRKFLPAAVVLLQLGNKVVHRFDERIAFFQTAVDLQLLPVFPGNARQDHMAAVLVDEGLPAAAQFAEQPVSQTGHGQHFHIHETLHLQVAECLLLRLQGILVRHQQNGPHRLRLRYVSRIQSAGPLLPNHVEYEFFLIQAFAAVVYVQHVLSL